MVTFIVTDVFFSSEALIQFLSFNLKIPTENRTEFSRGKLSLRIRNIFFVSIIFNHRPRAYHLTIRYPWAYLTLTFGRLQVDDAVAVAIVTCVETYGRRTENKNEQYVDVVILAIVRTTGFRLKTFTKTQSNLHPLNN